MRSQYVIILLVGFIAIIAGASLFALTALSDSRRFVSTDNAQVVADLVQVGSMNAGRIKIMNVDVGDAVVEGQAIAVLELPTAISRSGTTDTDKLGFREVQDLLVEVLAPTSGVIAARWARKGDIVPVGQRIVTLMDTSEIWIEANIDEDKIGRVHPDQSVEVEVESLERKVAGTVATISPVTTTTLNATPGGSASSDLKAEKRVIAVTITLDSNHPSLIPGSLAKIKIRTP